jgi:hypothetical protein
VNAWPESESAERSAAIGYHARCLALAMQNGEPVELMRLEGFPGTWWRVPPLWVGIVGNMIARVA